MAAIAYAGKIPFEGPSHFKSPPFLRRKVNFSKRGAVGVIYLRIMLQLELIHIVPFDLGLSVTDYDKPRNFPHEKFFKELSTNLNCEIESNDKLFFCKFSASRNIDC